MTSGVSCVIILARCFNLKQFERISHDIGIMGGKACISGTRVTVSMILTQISEGITSDELMAEYPHLTKGDIAEVLCYRGE